MQEILLGAEETPGSEPILFPDEPLKKKLIRNGFWLYFFSFIVAPTGYIIKVIASRELSVSDIGIFYSVLGVITLIATYNDLGLTEAIQYFLPHYFINKEFGKAKSILIFTLISQFISSFLIIIVLLFIAPWLATHYFHTPLALPLLQIFCICFLILNIFQVVQSLFIATQKIKWSQSIEAIRMWSIVAFVIIGWQFNILTVYTFTRYWLGGLILAAVVGLFAIRKEFGWLSKYKTNIDKKMVRQWFGYALWIIIGTNASIIISQIDQQFALYFFGSETAGYRTNYLTLFNGIMVISSPLITYLFPLLNELNKKNERAKIKLLNRMLYAGFFAFGLCVGVVAYFWGPEIAALLFGEKFRYSGELFALSAPFLWLAPIVGIQFQNLASHGKVRERVYLLLIAIVINCVLSLALMRTSLGVTGIIYGTAAGHLAIIIGSSFIGKKHDA